MQRSSFEDWVLVVLWFAWIGAYYYFVDYHRYSFWWWIAAIVPALLIAALVDRKRILRAWRKWRNRREAR